MHLVLIPFVLTGIGLVFVIPMMFFNFRFETTAIDSYLQNQMGSNHETFEKTT